MSVLIPESLTRLQAVVFVQNGELYAIGREAIIQASAENMAEQALRKIMRDCIKTEGDYMGYKGQTLRLDAYVLSPEELHKIVADAMERGERDAMRWGGGA